MQMSDLSSQIQHSTKYQSTGLQEVLATTHEVKALIDQYVDSSQQMTQVSQDLAVELECCKTLLQSIQALRVF
ncbi:hypothetical protein CSA56_01920 [candidate division KSB3 bacterium]|uniref:Uncharacterized protein n=1 Tax=candidate division KSB3 bacterium TaxID=2044937 RepID=A0A2G6KJX9_9BACT|nr:MAG: hypothetical protein CSA56_01920 [candidate division KSB3 bacterium]